MNEWSHRVARFWLRRKASRAAAEDCRKYRLEGFAALWFSGDISIWTSQLMALHKKYWTTSAMPSDVLKAYGLPLQVTLIWASPPLRAQPEVHGAGTTEAHSASAHQAA